MNTENEKIVAQENMNFMDTLGLLTSDKIEDEHIEDKHIENKHIENKQYRNIENKQYRKKKVMILNFWCMLC